MSGYHYNYTTNTLTTERGDCVNYQLGLVCRRIAIETRSLPFKLNDVCFTTSYCESTSERAGHFDILLRTIDANKNYLVLGSAAFGGQLDSAHNHVAKHFPLYRSIIPKHIAALSRWPMDWIKALGEPASQNRRFTSSVLDYLAQLPNFDQFSTTQDCWTDVVPDVRRIVDSHVDPWSFPSQDDVEEISRIVPDSLQPASANYPRRYWDRLKYRFSAAAIAIHFLDSLPTAVRKRMHAITLHEKHVSVGQPECHAEGLIPFCKENPQLRIARIVDLWGNVLQTRSDPLYKVVSTYRESPDPGLRKLRAEHVTEAIAAWVMEALALIKLGMPVGMFSLILDGALQPNKTFHVFQTVQVDIACQKAFELHCANPQAWVHKPSAVRWYETRKSPCYIMKGFPQAMQDILDDKVVSVECNFTVPPPLPPVFDPVALQWPSVWQHFPSFDDWALLKKNNHGADHDTEEPLKRWLSLRMKNLISDGVQNEGSIW
ncbi:uncharacterized protein J4E84_006787 [Alternaria hordeiaustralica]|uniref:uncharacterized protein n=1 Tax=Alternaria hordeiaustralica TaxID=1187925 RepID=UPI0020C24787|nr:uncharacterized protein J4E84_006787 [Alternaria hordeiaustralica]KAI4683947.1 hypothetical protein J4E84_006787 [Alternaria hordeiaustralica]